VGVTNPLAQQGISVKLHLAICALIVALAGCSDAAQAPPTALLVVVRAGTGTGTVSASVAGIDCGSDCTESFAEGTPITLTAVPTTGSTFSGWSGGGCGGTGACVPTLSGNTTITATFTLNRYTLSVGRSGTGSGRVTSLPAGVDCGTDCSEAYGHGETVTLTAGPAVGSAFAGWSGGGCTGSDACTVTLTGALTVTAVFNLTPQTLSVSTAGNGSGTITSSPAGVSCGSDCSEDYNYGTRVTLTATAGVGSSFVGWSGGGCSGTGTCAVTLTAPTNVTATFNQAQVVLTVNRTGNGSGTVTSTPTGVSCGSDCSEIYNYGTGVALSAAPAVGSTFAGWSGGGCSGTGTCVVTLTAATTVTATFSLPQYLLTVTKAGGGTGTVTSNPAGVNCGTDCSEPYTAGTSVTLTASPTTGFGFVGWSGAGCSGTGTCVVTVNAATTVVATFSDTGPPTLVSSTPADATIGVDDGTTIRLTFSEPMDQAATQAAFQVTQPAGTTGTFQWQGNVMIFTPTTRFACLPGGNVVQWRLTTAARDVSGNLLAAQVDRSFRVIRCVQEFLFAETARDGYITSTGTVSSNATNIYVGDFANGTYSRGFVSFDFSSIPTDAQVSAGSLEMTVTQIGTVSQLGPLLAEPVAYGTLNSSDFGLGASGPAVTGTVFTTLVAWTLDAAVTAAWANRVNLGSRFQLRIRTTYDNHINGAVDAFDFVSGESATQGQRPVLAVTYKTP
jgi:hypothetical protein